MRYFIKIGQVKEKTDLLEKELAIIDENIKKLQLLKDNLEWHGDAANQFYFNYDNYLSDLKKIQKKVIDSILFLASFYDKYSDEYLRLKTKYANILNEEAYQYDKVQ